MGQQVACAERANIGFEYVEGNSKPSTGVVVELPPDITAKLRNIVAGALANWQDRTGKAITGDAHMQIYMSVKT